MQLNIYMPILQALYTFYLKSLQTGPARDMQNYSRVGAPSGVHQDEHANNRVGPGCYAIHLHGSIKEVHTK